MAKGRLGGSSQTRGFYWETDLKPFVLHLGKEFVSILPMSLKLGVKLDFCLFGWVLGSGGFSG